MALIQLEAVDGFFGTSDAIFFVNPANIETLIPSLENTAVTLTSGKSLFVKGTPVEVKRKIING